MTHRLPFKPSVQGARGHGAGIGLDLDVLRLEGLVAVGAAQLGVGQFAAALMAEEDGRAGVACSPAVTPGHDREQQVGELPALLGQHVVVTQRSLRVDPLLDHALRHEPLEALREHLARDPEVALELVEAGEADPDVADDERRPGLACDLEGARDRAGHVAEIGSLHAAIVA